MRPQVNWIDQPMAGRLAIMARPRAGDWLDDEIAGWRAQGIDIVVSLLEPDEISELGLQREEGLCRAQGMEFVAFPIQDRGVPGSLRGAVALARLVSNKIGEGRSVAVHCRAGIGSSSLIAALRNSVRRAACLSLIQKHNATGARRFERWSLPLPECRSHRAAEREDWIASSLRSSR
jgi:protein-tyrosine phosphatase